MLLRDTICSIENCEKPYRAKGLCHMHYMRKWVNGTTESKHRTECVIEGCVNAHKSLGWCSMHYTRFRTTGNPLVTRRDYGVGLTPEERFWSKVDKTVGLGRDGDCWEWLGKSVSEFGYGKVQRNKIQMGTHILAWIYTYGTKPILQLLHSCDNPKCVNPDHLREGTQQENIQDAKDRNRMAVGKTVNPKAVDADVVRRARILFAHGYSRNEVMTIEQISYRTARNIDTERAYQWVS